MKKILVCATTILFAQLGFSADWDYQQAADWGKNQKYSACNGANQSPINIDKTVHAQLEPLRFSYNSTLESIENNGHSIQVNVAEGGLWQIDGELFMLKQFHVHTPSENQIKGKNYPMEVHFVHANPKGELAVLGMMYEYGPENPSLARMWQHLPKKKGEKITLIEQYLVHDFLPKNLNYYRFSGSLTTPPCSEGVRWFILKDVQKASVLQISAFADLMGLPNNRPIQPLNGRVVLE